MNQTLASCDRPSFNRAMLNMGEALRGLFLSPPNGDAQGMPINYPQEKRFHKKGMKNHAERKPRIRHSGDIGCAMRFRHARTDAEPRALHQLPRRRPRGCFAT